MNRFFTLSGLIAALFLLAGCATVQGDWEKARKSDTVYAYQEFMANHPSSEFDTEAKTRMEEIEWARALKNDEADTYSLFKNKYPKSRHIPEAEARMAELKWAYVKKINDLGSYAYFLKTYPASPHADEAEKRLRELKFETAKKTGSVKYVEEFLKAYPQGEDSEMLRRELPALRVWEPRENLANAIIRLRPKSEFTVAELIKGKVGAQPDAYKADLTVIRSLLERGVDPNAVKIAGWTPARETHGISFIGGSAVPTRNYTMGTPGNPVPVDKPGMTLLEYCKANDLKEAYELLKSHGAK